MTLALFHVKKFSLCWKQLKLPTVNFLSFDWGDDTLRPSNFTKNVFDRWLIRLKMTSKKRAKLRRMSARHHSWSEKDIVFSSDTAWKMEMPILSRMKMKSTMSSWISSFLHPLLLNGHVNLTDDKIICISVFSLSLQLEYPLYFFRFWCLFTPCIFIGIAGRGIISCKILKEGSISRVLEVALSANE